MTSRHKTKQYHNAQQYYGLALSALLILWIFSNSSQTAYLISEMRIKIAYLNQVYHFQIWSLSGGILIRKKNWIFNYFLIPKTYVKTFPGHLQLQMMNNIDALLNSPSLTSIFAISIILDRKGLDPHKSNFFFYAKKPIFISKIFWKLSCKLLCPFKLWAKLIWSIYDNFYHQDEVFIM